MADERNNLENDCTWIGDQIHGVLVGFGIARKAAGTWDFTNRADGTRLRIFCDDENLPIAVDFSRYPEPLGAVHHESKESFHAAAMRLYAFACQMIDQAQIQQGDQILREAMEVRPTFGPLLHAAVHRALLIKPGECHPHNQDLEAAR